MRTLIAPSASSRASIAQRAGIEVSNGIVRVEHWANALHQGPAAARNMLGAQVPYERIPYFFSDQYDVGMEYSGHVSGWDEIVVRGDVAKRELIAFWLRDGRGLAGMNVNVRDVTDDIQPLIRSGEAIDRARLADPDVPLADLLPAGAREADCAPRTARCAGCGEQVSLRGA